MYYNLDESVFRVRYIQVRHEPLMSLLFTLSTCRVESEESSQLVQYPCLKFDEFLVENIHSQLMDFHKTRSFIFQSYLLKMFLSFNDENLHLPEMVLTEEMSRDYSKFMNHLMSEVYRVIFQKKLPRLFLKMKDISKFSPDKRIGDWFLFEQGIMIRLYGFVHQPYLFPTLFTPRVFSMEVIRQRLIVETEHFLNFKKPSEIKFPWAVGPFIIKNKVSLLNIESLMKEMGFFYRSFY